MEACAGQVVSRCDSCRRVGESVMQRGAASGAGGQSYGRCLPPTLAVTVTRSPTGCSVGPERCTQAPYVCCLPLHHQSLDCLRCRLLLLLLLPHMSLLVPPVNFGMVSDGLYRSSEPTELNFPFLASLHLRTILHLGHHPPSAALAYYVDDHNSFPAPHQPHTTLTLTHLNAQPHSHTPHHTTSVAAPPHSHTTGYSLPLPHSATTPSSLTEHTVIAALSLILSPHHLPCLVCCATGGHSTGVVVGCYRRVEGWSLQAIYSEYRRYAEEGVGGMNEQFIELFDVELVGGRRGRGRVRGAGSGLMGGGLLDGVSGASERRRESESSLSRLAGDMG